MDPGLRLFTSGRSISSNPGQRPHLRGGDCCLYFDGALAWSGLEFCDLGSLLRDSVGPVFNLAPILFPLDCPSKLICKRALVLASGHIHFSSNRSGDVYFSVPFTKPDLCFPSKRFIQFSSVDNGPW